MNQLDELQQLIYECLHDQGFERRYPDPDLDGCLMVTANFEGFEERND